jgi:addiction module RelB/DinJ family antitoxin
MTYEKVRSNVYLDKNLKEKAKELFREYGLSLSDGLNMLLKQAIEKKDKFLIPELEIEPVYPDDPDYKIMQEAKKARKEGEKVYSVDEVAKKLGIDL